MSARLLWRSLTIRRSTFLLALLAVTVGATVTATLLNLKADLQAKMSRELRRYGPNLLVTPAPGAPSSTLDQARVESIPAALARKGIAAGPSLSSILIAAGRIGPAGPGDGTDRPARNLRGATLMGAEFRTLALLNPSWRLDGRYPSPGEPSGVVGSALARRAGLSPGDRAVVEVNGRLASLRVSGVLSTGESEEGEALLPLEFLQELTGQTGRISVAELSVDGGAAAVTRAARAIEAAMAEASARPLWQVAEAQGRILGKLDWMMFLLTLIILLLCGLCVMTTLLSMVLEREREIGLMRSIGAGDGEVLWMFLGEVSLLGIFGGVLGLALGAAAARLIGNRLFDAAIEPRASVVPMVLAVSLVLCWAAVLLPLRRALAVQPATALRGA